MALKDTVSHMKGLLSSITRDLEKANAGNKAAAQRVRTGTIKMEKLSKLYRKESVTAERKELKALSAKKPRKKAAKR